MSLAMLGLRPYIKTAGLILKPITCQLNLGKIVDIVSFVLKFQLIANVCFDTNLLPNRTTKAIV